MPRKQWVLEHRGMTIRFVNHWTFSGHCLEELYVNDDLVSHADVSCKDDSMRDYLFGRHQVDYEFGGRQYAIEVQAGNKWPGIFIGCHIYVNGELLGGDVKRRLLFKNDAVRGSDGFS